MDAMAYWQLFLETGAPELYLMYHRARKTEDGHVLDDQGTGASGVSLQ